MKNHIIVIVFQLLGAFLSLDACRPSDVIRSGGCSKIKGAAAVTVGGTVIDDSMCDVLLPRMVFAREPKVVYGGADVNKTYTIIIISPDYPDNLPDEVYLLMMKTNVSGKDLLVGDTQQKGVVVQGFMQPKLETDTGFLRYIFLVYEQPSENLKVSTPKRRTSFNLPDWAKEYLLCEPQAGGQFRALFGI